MLQVFTQPLIADCHSRIEFVAEKSRLTGGKKRAIHFENGSSNEEEISAPGFLKNELLVAVAQVYWGV